MVINGLWIGGSLSSVEILCIKSFLDNGHEFVLWTYGKLDNDLPEGLAIRDAGEIIPAEQVFQYRHKNQFGHGKGSYAGFSDIFRYKLLYDRGGWWADMDITCLKPLDFQAPYVFRTHHNLKVVGNIMKCPPGSELMLRCYQLASESVNAENRDWHKPIQILNDTIEELGLQQYIIEMSNRDSWNEVRKMINRYKKIPGHWYVIHWINVEWPRNGVNKEYSGKDSLLRSLYEKHQVPVHVLTPRERLKNRLRLSLSVVTARYLWSWGWGYVAYYFRYFRKKPRSGQ